MFLTRSWPGGSLSPTSQCSLPQLCTYTSRIGWRRLHRAILLQSSVLQQICGVSILTTPACTLIRLQYSHEQCLVDIFSVGPAPTCKIHSHSLYHLGGSSNAGTCEHWFSALVWSAVCQIARTIQSPAHRVPMLLLGTFYRPECNPARLRSSVV